MTQTVDQLEAQVTRAQRAADKARAAADEARQRAERERAARLQDYDRALLESWDVRAEAEMFNAARKALADAVAADPLTAAWVGFKAAQMRRAHHAVAVAAAAGRLGEPAPAQPQPVDRADFAEVGRIVDELAQQANADYVDELDADRERAGEG